MLGGPHSAATVQTNAGGDSWCQRSIDVVEALAGADQAQGRLASGLRLPACLYPVLAGAVAVQLATTAYGIAAQTVTGLVVVLVGLVTFKLHGDGFEFSGELERGFVFSRDRCGGIKSDLCAQQATALPEVSAVFRGAKEARSRAAGSSPRGYFLRPLAQFVDHRRGR